MTSIRERHHSRICISPRITGSHGVFESGRCALGGKAVATSGFSFELPVDSYLTPYGKSLGCASRNGRPGSQHDQKDHNGVLRNYCSGNVHS